MMNSERYFHLLTRLGLAWALLVAVGRAETDPVLHFTFDLASPWVNEGSATATLLSKGAKVIPDSPVGGQALQLTTAGPNYAAAQDVTGLAGLSQFTICAWVKVSSLSGQADRLLSSLGNGSGLDFSIQGTPQALTICLGVNSQNSQFSEEAVNGADWVFLAATYRSDAPNTGTVKFYCGDLAQEMRQLGKPRYIGGTNQGGGAIRETADREHSILYVGATPQTAANRTPTALVDDIRLYARILSLAELESLRKKAVANP